jgi:hypothetical protein
MELSSTQKKYAAIILGLLAGIIAALTQCTEEGGPTPAPSPSVIVSPSAIPAPSLPPGGVLVLDSFERPELAPASAWKPAAARVVLKGASTGFVLSAPKPCDLVGTPNLNALGTVTTAHPSYEGARVGDWSEVVVPLSAANCAASKFLWLEVPHVALTNEVRVGGARVTVTPHARALPTNPSVPLLAELSQNYLQFGHFGKYGGMEAELSRMHLAVMTEHRISAMKSWIVSPPVVSGALDLTSGPFPFRDNVLTPSLGGPVSFPNFATAAELQALNATVKANGLSGRAFLYSVDEPREADLADPASSIVASLKIQKQYAPDAQRLVTKYRSATWAADPYIDIYVPVLNHFDQGSYPGPAAYAGKRLGLYPSCMSHGCTGCDGPVEGRTCYVAYQDTGLPDLVLDRSGVHPFALYALALRYSPAVSFLLYYNVVELERLTDARPWQNPWAFGGNLDGELQFALRPGEFGVTAQTAAPSLREKLLREASHLADVLTLLRAQDPAWVDQKLTALVRKPNDWTRDPAAYQALLADALTRLK